MAKETADLVTFIEEILNGKLHFLCSAGITVDNKLNFNLNIDKICLKNENQLNALVRLKLFLRNKESKILIVLFFKIPIIVLWFGCY